MSTYILGANQQELDRLRFQHEVWGGVTRAFLDRIGVSRGQRCLDLGCGPGFVVEDLLARVGETGSVVALDESKLWIEFLTSKLREQRIDNVELVQSRIQDADLEPASLDVIFSRWVFSFLPEPASIVRKLARALKPGGIFAIEDYNHEGISVFPESEGMRAVVRATRSMYTQSGGDPWVAGRARKIFREAGLETISVTPNVLCGPPDSPAFRWAGRFFPHFSEAMVKKGLMTAGERELFLREWAEREGDPDALFFSPFIVDACARRLA
jgi:ubiquinone/menaquinone biosynthesis C-methylase UbiE